MFFNGKGCNHYRLNYRKEQKGPTATLLLLAERKEVWITWEIYKNHGKRKRKETQRQAHIPWRKNKEQGVQWRWWVGGGHGRGKAAGHSGKRNAMGTSGLNWEMERPQKPHLHVKLYQVKKEARYTLPGLCQICTYIYTYILTIHNPLVKSILPAVQKPLCSFSVEKDTGGQGPSGEGERKAIAQKSDT